MVSRDGRCLSKFWPIVTVPIENEGDVVAVRQRAHRVAELLGFDRQDQTRIATAVSELARNAFGYAGGGRAEFALDADHAPQRFVVRICDQGPGIANLQTILDGQYRSTSGMGLGLVGARRLMDTFSIDSKPGKGTKVEVGHKLPGRLDPWPRAKLTEIVSSLKKETSSDPLTALREQNRELMQSLEEMRRREEESQQLNQELGDTNRGVVALYAELDGRAEQLRQASELKTRFLSNMSHEFRTPLNSVLALSRLLLDRIDGDLTSEQERQVGYIRRSAESLLELVNDMLDLAKVEAGKAEVKPVRFSVASLFGALRGALKPLLTSASVELVFEPAAGFAAALHRRGEGRANPAQPDFQRAEVHRTGRSAGHRAAERRRTMRHLRCARHRHRNRAGRSRAHLRGVLPGRRPGCRKRSRAPASACRCRVRWHGCLAATSRWKVFRGKVRFSR